MILLIYYQIYYSNDFTYVVILIVYKMIDCYKSFFVVKTNIYTYIVGKNLETSVAIDPL